MLEPSHTPCPFCGQSQPDQVTEVLDSARHRILGIIVGRESQKKLSSMKNDILDCYLVENMTQQQIAEELGTTQPNVSEHINDILDRVYDLMTFYETYPFRYNVFYE